jgi:hypothetical protein
MEVFDFRLPVELVDKFDHLLDEELFVIRESVVAAVNLNELHDL